MWTHSPNTKPPYLDNFSAFHCHVQSLILFFTNSQEHHNVLHCVHIGGPVACFCLLSNPQANMLWQDRWENLLLPYLSKLKSSTVMLGRMVTI